MMSGDLWILGYVGPETVMPVASAVAAVVGFFLMLGRSSVRWIFRLLRLSGRKEAQSEADRP